MLREDYQNSVRYEIQSLPLAAKLAGAPAQNPDFLYLPRTAGRRDGGREGQQRPTGAS